MNNQKDEKQITTAHQTLENIMKIAFGSPDFEKFGLASPPHYILDYGMKNGKDIAMLMGTKDIKKNDVNQCQSVWFIDIILTSSHFWRKI